MRLLEVEKDTVNRVILRAGVHCAKVFSELLTSLEMTEVQLDELWTFIKKEKFRQFRRPQKPLRPSMDLAGHRRPTLLLITFWIGGCEFEDARQMLKDLTDRLIAKPLFVSDELSHYRTVLGELFHELVPQAPTDKPERPRNPERVIDTDLDYAAVHKTRQGAKVIKLERKVGHGSGRSILTRLANSPSHSVKTAYIERSNLDWRLWDAHLTRKATTVARSMRWLKAKFATCVACYNLMWPYETT